MPWHYDSESTVPERIVGGICYFTFGLAGLIYILLSGKRGQSRFFRFHFLQSILLGIMGILLSWTAKAFLMVASSVSGTLGLSLTGVGIAATAIEAVVGLAWLLLLYGTIWSFLGKYAEIPFISPVVRRQI